MTQVPAPGVELVGSGIAVPEKIVTNKDLELVMDTSDEWIVQRTGIQQRHVVDHTNGETTRSLALQAAQNTLNSIGLSGKDIDLVITATMTPDMPTPGISSLVAHELGTNNAGGFDINGACSGFVFSLNVAHEMVKGGGFNTVLVIGADLLTRYITYNTRGRSTSVLFGDAAGAVVVRRTNTSGKGLLAQSMATDGGGARHLYIPCHAYNILGDSDPDPDLPLDQIRMNGPSVFRFAVGTFPKLIGDTLDKAGLRPDEVDHYICHQSNARILEAARDRYNLPAEKFRVNISQYGNTVAASIPLVYNELFNEGLLLPDQKIMFLGFGAGLTWGASLWQV